MVIEINKKLIGERILKILLINKKKLMPKKLPDEKAAREEHRTKANMDASRE